MSACPALATAAMPGSSESLVVLSGDVDIPEGTHVAEVVVFHGPVSVEGMVHGDVVALDGPVTVSGLVLGSVVSLDDSVDVRQGARVTGDVISSEVSIAKGAQIDGQTKGINEALTKPLRWLGFIAWWIPLTFSTLFLGLLLLWWFPRATDAAAVAARSNPSASGGLGVLVFAGIPILAFVAMITLVGIPFGLGLLLASGLVYSTGYVLGMLVLGRLIVREPRGRIGAFLAGWAILRVLALIPWVSGLSGFLAISFGFGAATVALHRTRRTRPLPDAA